jgi:wyosine [tRNA(Phe)-imidazoG37] synthetase (radical SAM superfamily)
MRHLFGPVPSRRLGMSLGIDLVPPKTCPLNCLYCEAGRTTRHTAERGEYIPVDEILAELDEYLKPYPHLDHITFSGAGEPTLHSGIGQIVEHLHTHWPQYRIALITNGIGLINPAMRQEALGCSVVLPSLDAGTEAAFQRINRPCPGITLDALTDGLIAFRKEYSGLMLLEVFLLEGVNDDSAELAAIAERVRRIQPDQVQLNSLDRPGAEAGLIPVSHERLASLTGLFAPIPAIPITRQPSGGVSQAFSDLQEMIVSTVKRRPCTVQDLVLMTGHPVMEIQKVLRELLSDGRIESQPGERGEFYR